MKAAALRGALSDRARNDRVHVVSALVSGDTPSTKTAAAALAKISEARHVLVVLERGDEVTWKSLRNLPTVHLLEPGQLNTYDVLISDDVVFTHAALEAFLGGPATGKSAKGAATSAEVDDDVEVAAPAAAAAEVADDVDEPVAEEPVAEQAPVTKAAAKKAPAKKAPTKKAAAKKAPAAVDTGSDDEAEASDEEQS
jgi:large subunit ribosomal protein L4